MSSTSSTPSNLTEDKKLSKQNLGKPDPSVGPSAGGGGAEGGLDEFEAWIKSKQLFRPDDQLDLTEAELSEEVPKVLQTDNTNIVKNLAIYSFSEGGYVPAPPTTNTITLFELESTILHVDSEEAKLQRSMEDDDYEPEIIPDEAPPVATEDAATGEGEPGDEEADGEGGEEGEGEAGEEVAADEGEEEAPAAAPAPSGKKAKLINQFNYCERAALTYNNPMRCVETQTIPPPRSTYSDSVLQWVIYDSYTQDFELQQREREKETKKAHVLKRDGKSKKSESTESEELNRKYLLCWQILERMVNQNIFDEIAHDYRYWEDPSDEYRNEEGTLLPLWKFSYEKTKKLNVTDMCFNTNYYDLFAVCYGSLDFMKQTNEGYVCLFTIKNPSYPDYKLITESGVMCCDIHPKYPYLVVIGMYDGNVAVYNLKVNVKEPIYISNSDSGKHSECVWEIKWGPDMTDGEINFYSLSSDGRVFNGVLMQNKLSLTTIITLYLEADVVGGPDGTQIKLNACGTCLIFHPENPDIFLVGTEEGIIYKCSTAFSSKYLMVYAAHYQSIYRIDFNKFDSNIFVSCGGDWRVKVWEDMRSDPLFIFDLGSSVGDVKWAPYSSTVFAAVTAEGKVFVFDLNVNKYKAICIQQVVPKKRSKCTRICFNQKLPFIIVGDEKGTITSLKLSPNLRLKVKPPKKQQNLGQKELQEMKLQKLLSLVRELPNDTTTGDTASSSAS